MSVIAELLRSKAQANKTARYIQSLEQFLTQFVRGRELTPISEFTTTHIEEWLSRYSNPCTRQTWLTRLSTLFAYAKRRKYIAANPCDDIECVTIDRNPPRILSPSQVETLLKACPKSVLPYLVLSVFVGLRPEGIAARKIKGKPRRILDWSAIDLEAKTVRVTEKRKWRLVPLEPRAVELLAPLAKSDGPVVPSHSAVRTWHVRARKLLGFAKWPPDILRHTAASQLMALIKDAGIVSTRLGHSEGILWKHYHNPVTQADCRKFWKVNERIAEGPDDNQLDFWTEWESPD